MQPINREAKRELNEFEKNAHKLLTKSSKFPSRNIGRRPQMTAKLLVKKHDIPMTKIPYFCVSDNTGLRHWRPTQPS